MRRLSWVMDIQRTCLLLPILAVAVLVVGGAAACSTEVVPKGSATVEEIHGLPVEGAEEGYEVGNQAPEFALRLAGGERLTLTEIKESGRPTFLFFWATT